MRVAIACGGTGGHLFPGLAVAQELHNRGHEALLFVSEKAIDATALRAHPEFRAEKLPSIGMPPVFSPAFVRFLQRMWESMGLCRQILKRFRPDAVLAMGGFTSLPPVLQARRMGLPCFVHESNAIPGKANRFCARFATRVLLGFEEAASWFRFGDCLFTGTPVRLGMERRLPAEQARLVFRLDPQKKTLLVTGGSQGAAGVNQLLFRNASRLASAGVQVIHLTGERDEQLAAANYLRAELPAYVAAFYEKMEEAYCAADLVVSRAGASSLTEIAYFGLPSVLVPYPFAADNHQEANAKIFERKGAAEVVRESDSTAESFGILVENLMANDSRRAKMAEAAASLLPRDSAARVADVLEREGGRGR